MKYKVTSQYARDAERQLAMFESQDDAKTFVEAKIAKDALLKVKIIYRIYKDFDVLEEISSEQDTSGATAKAPSSQGQGSGANFRPSPFDTSPKPAGMPKKWIVNGTDDDKKKG